MSCRVVVVDVRDISEAQCFRRRETSLSSQSFLKGLLGDNCWKETIYKITHNLQHQLKRTG